MKKFFKIFLLRNRWSDFETLLQESGFDISGRPDCQIRAVIATGKLPSAFVAHRASKIVGPLSSIWVFIADTGIFEI